jgi:DNA-binding PadR family transcriptional regulator
VVLACLLALREPGYGYGLLKTLEAAGIPSDGNTVYPLLRRLEERGLLESEWNTDESRPRKFYRTTAAGAELATQLIADVTALTKSLHSLNGRS